VAERITKQAVISPPPSRQYAVRRWSSLPEGGVFYAAGRLCFRLHDGQNTAVLRSVGILFHIEGDPWLTITPPAAQEKAWVLDKN
jgi:hypothetical protein